MKEEEKWKLEEQVFAKLVQTFTASGYRRIRKGQITSIARNILEKNRYEIECSLVIASTWDGMVPYWVRWDEW